MTRGTWYGVGLVGAVVLKLLIRGRDPFVLWYKPPPREIENAALRLLLTPLLCIIFQGVGATVGTTPPTRGICG